MEGELSNKSTHIHHPVFARFPLLTTSDVPPDFHWGFLGERRRMSFDAGVAAQLGLPATTYSAGQVREAVYPAIDEEYFEWVELLEAVVGAIDSFTMIELGAGYGRWSIRAALAIKAYHGNMPFRLICVEPEPTHFEWMNQHFRDNGIDPGSHDLIEAAVNDSDGEVLFHIGRPDSWYGQSIATSAEASSELTRQVKALSLNQILSTVACADLIDLDVQGAEFDVLSSAVDVLDQNVKRVHIGTHGHDIEDNLRALFREHTWYKINDYSCQSTELTQYGEIHFGDGVQTWINPRLSRLQPSALELARSQKLQETAERREAGLRASLQWLQHQDGRLERDTRLEAELIGVRTELESVKAVLRNIERSKFWKLRAAWVKLKALTGLTRHP